jgi:phage FluMu protein Com
MHNNNQTAPQGLNEDDFACAICTSTINECASCPHCACLFCNECLLEWKRQSSSNQCPHCQQRVTEYMKCKGIDKLIGKLLEPCEHCHTMITRRDMNTHVEKYCPIIQNRELQKTVEELQMHNDELTELNRELLIENEKCLNLIKQTRGKGESSLFQFFLLLVITGIVMCIAFLLR